MILKSKDYKLYKYNGEYPTIFADSNNKTSQIEFALYNAKSNFKNDYRKVENFITSKRPHYRDTKIHQLSLVEYLFLSQNLQISDTDSIINSGICAGNIRIFISDLIPNDYYIINFYYSNNRMISIFIGENFYKDDLNYLRLIYDLAELTINIELENVFIPINRMDNINNLIVLPDFSIPSDARFIFDYYSFIFQCIMNNTNNDIIHSFSCVYNIENGRPIESLLPDAIMEKIWLISNKIIESSYDIDSEINECIKEIYSYLMEPKGDKLC